LEGRFIFVVGDRFPPDETVLTPPTCIGLNTNSSLSSKDIAATGCNGETCIGDNAATSTIS
jgi:hypothetical protein